MPKYGNRADGLAVHLGINDVLVEMNDCIIARDMSSG
jgi:hypothetical protein